MAASPAQLEARVAAEGATLDGLGDLVEAASALRELLSNSRPLQPADLAPPGAPPVAVLDASAASRRLDDFADAVSAARDLLDAAVQPPDVTAAPLKSALLAADLLGTTQPVPTTDDLNDLIPAAMTARAELSARLAAHDPQAPAADRLGALAGSSAWVLPALTPTDPWPGPAPAGATPAEVQRHIMRSAAVRPAVSRLDRVLGVIEALAGTTPVLSVTQQPLDAGERWAALGGGQVKGGRTSLVAHLPSQLTGPIAGLYVDEWTDVVPDPQVTTSIAFHYDGPSSAPPNVALLGVSRPGAEQWTADEVIGVVSEALAIAALRGVDPDALAGAGQLIPPLLSREDPTPGVSATLDIPALTEPS